MSQQEDQLDLIEDITVEELLQDGLIENVEVSDEEPSKKKSDDEQDAEMKAEETKENTPEKAVDSVEKAVDSVEKAEEPKVQSEENIDDVEAAIDAAPEAEAPKTKAGLISAMYQHMSKMTTEELAAMYGEFTEPEAEKISEEEESDSSEAVAEENEKIEEESDEVKEETESEKEEEESEEEKEEEKSESEKEEEEKEEEMKEGVDALLAAQESLSEEFRSEASKLFEDTVKAKVAEEVKSIEESYQARLNEEIEEIENTLAEKVDSYLNYVVKTWMEENKVGIEKGLRTEIAEGFIEGLKNLFKESYIEVPEGKENQVDTLNHEISKLEEQLTKATESNMKLVESVNALERARVLSEASSDLASTEAIKLTSLTEDIDFEDVESFKQKVQTVKESYFSKSAVNTNTTDVEASETEQVSSVMEAYSHAISRAVKKS